MPKVGSYSDIMSSFAEPGRAVFERRIALGLTVEKLAEGARVSQPTVTKAERGIPIRALKAERIAQALGIGRDLIATIEALPEPERQEATA